MTRRARGALVMAGLSACVDIGGAAASDHDLPEALRRARERDRPYFECVRQHAKEMELVRWSREVRDLIQMQSKLRALNSTDPQILDYAAKVDLQLLPTFTNYQLAGGQAAAPEAVQVPEPPCKPAAAEPPPPGITIHQGTFEKKATSPVVTEPPVPSR